MRFLAETLGMTLLIRQNMGKRGRKFARMRKFPTPFSLAKHIAPVIPTEGRNLLEKAQNLNPNPSYK